MAEKKKELHLLRYAELFDDKLVTVSAHAPKKFRNNIVHDLQMTSENIVKSIFWANEYRQSDIQECLKYTKQAEINIRWMTRRLERARRMQCITPVEELDLGGKLATVEEYFVGWSDSNKKLSEELRQEELRKKESLGRDTGQKRRFVLGFLSVCCMHGFFMGLVSSSPRNAMNLNYNNRSMNNNNVTNTWIGVRPALVSIRKDVPAVRIRRYVEKTRA